MTVTVQSKVFPFEVCTVILVVPVEIAVTLPWTGVTVAIAVSLEEYVTVLSLALSGLTVAVNISEAPIARDNVSLFNVTSVGAMLFLLQESQMPQDK